jgi:hypothetical protein
MANYSLVLGSTNQVIQFVYSKEETFEVHPDLFWVEGPESIEDGKTEAEYVYDNKEIKKLNLQKKLTEYKELRKNEYPDIIEYIDGVVKGDQQQIQNYINKCLEVKKKYPKSEGTE